MDTIDILIFSVSIWCGDLQYTLQSRIKCEEYILECAMVGERAIKSRFDNCSKNGKKLLIKIPLT